MFYTIISKSKYRFAKEHIYQLNTHYITLLFTVTSCIASEHTNNLALGKTAYQSSNHSTGQSSPHHGVDGKLDTNYDSGRCIHTGSYDSPPWWLVDLGESYVISTVIVVNRDIHGK